MRNIRPANNVLISNYKTLKRSPIAIIRIYGHKKNQEKNEMKEVIFNGFSKGFSMGWRSRGASA